MSNIFNKPPYIGVDLGAKIGASKYFTWAEALWLDSVKAYASPDFVQRQNIERQALLLDRVREHFGKPVIVTSWLRPTKYNTWIGGAERSAHRDGIATDFYVKGLSCSEVKEELQANPTIYPGRGEIDTTNWVHLDLKPGDWFYARPRYE